MTRKPSVGAALLLLVVSLVTTATAVSGKEASKSVPAGAAATPRSDPSLVGSWSKPRRTPLVGVHTTTLRTGEVLLFSDAGDGRESDAYLWNPQNGKFRSARLDKYDLFCSGHSVLADGRVLVTGGQARGGHKHNGDDTNYAGIKAAHLFDPIERSWTRIKSMKAARWYPTNTTLPDGRVIVTSGNNQMERLTRRVEVYNPESGKWRTVKRAKKLLDLYPRQHVLANGRLLMAGPRRETLFLNLSSWRWSRGPQTLYPGRYEGTTVLLDGAKKVLAFGGREDDAKSATRTAETLDTDAKNPGWRRTGSLRYGRVNLGGVILADSTVLAIGGNRKGERKAPVKVAELYDPGTGRWRKMTAQKTARSYHSTAVLLTDGRVLSMGGDENYTYEIFSPPYLFKGPRPEINSVSGSSRYGGDISVSVKDASAVSRLALVRPGSVTHSVDMEQRYLSLSFRREGNRLIANAPEDANAAPPGYYMLFAVSDKGVPSEAKFVRLGDDSIGGSVPF